MYITSQEGSSPLVSNEPQLHLIFQASEPVKDFEPEDIEILGGPGVISSFQAISGTQFEAVFTEQKSDDDEQTTHYTIKVRENTFTDEVGNLNQEQSNFEYTYDGTSPVVHEIRARTDQDDGVIIMNTEFDSEDTYLAQVPEQDRDYSGVFANDAIGTGHARSTINSAQAWSAPTNSAVSVNLATQTSGTWMSLELDDTMWIYGVAIQGRSVNYQDVTKMSVFVDERLVLSNLLYVVVCSSAKRSLVLLYNP